MRPRQQTDIAVVGGGLTGAALAYGLARRGLSVALFERLDRARLLRGPGQAAIWAQREGAAPPARAAWDALAHRHWRAFDEELRTISASLTHYERPGGLRLFADPEQGRARQRRARREGVAVEWLSPAAVRRLAPALSGDLAGACYCAGDAQLDRQRFARALDRALHNLGARRHFLAPIERLDPLTAGYRLRGPGVDCHAARVVLASGAQSPALDPQGGGAGGAVALQRRLETAPLSHCLPFAAAPLAQARSGAVLIDLAAQETAEDGLRRAAAQMPALAGAGAQRVWEDSVWQTSAALPCYRRSAAGPGLFCVASPDGLLHAPLHAQFLAAWVAGRLPDAALAALAGERCAGAVAG